MASKLLDSVLDRSIVGGYTKFGYELRRRTWNPEPAVTMEGRRALVTGATSGIGRATASGLAALGAEVVLLARDAERGRGAAEQLRASAPGATVSVELCDISRLQSVRECCARIAAGGALDVLVANAGVLPPGYELTADGVELTFATNVLGPFLMTWLLLERLREGEPGRVITVSSGGMYSQKLPAVAQSGREDFDGTTAYARTKRQEVVLSELWAQRVPAAEAGFFSMHPGWVDTPGLRASLPAFHRVSAPLLRNPRQGADTIVWLASSPGLRGESGGFWHDRRRRPEHILPWTRESGAEREALWEECVRLAGLDATA